jgi:hypothetical protein
VKEEAARAPCKFYLVVVAQMNRSVEVCASLREGLRWSAEVCAMVCDGLRKFTGVRATPARRQCQINSPARLSGLGDRVPCRCRVWRRRIGQDGLNECPDTGGIGHGNRGGHGSGGREINVLERSFQDLRAWLANAYRT